MSGVTCVHVERDVFHDHVGQGDDGADDGDAVHGWSPTAEEKPLKSTFHARSKCVKTREHGYSPTHYKANTNDPFSKGLMEGVCEAGAFPIPLWRTSKERAAVWSQWWSQDSRQNVSQLHHTAHHLTQCSGSKTSSVGSRVVSRDDTPPPHTGDRPRRGQATGHALLWQRWGRAGETEDLKILHCQPTQWHSNTTETEWVALWNGRLLSLQDSQGGTHRGSWQLSDNPWEEPVCRDGTCWNRWRCFKSAKHYWANTTGKHSQPLTLKTDASLRYYGDMTESTKQCLQNTVLTSTNVN